MKTKVYIETFEDVDIYKSGMIYFCEFIAEKKITFQELYLSDMYLKIALAQRDAASQRWIDICNKFDLDYSASTSQIVDELNDHFVSKIKEALI